MPDQTLRYLHLYPAQDTVRAGEPLNVMFAVKNMERADSTEQLRLYLCPSDGPADWRLALEEQRVLPARAITHIYMRIPASAFDPARWDGAAHEEFLLLCADAPPADAPAKHCTALVQMRP